MMDFTGIEMSRAIETEREVERDSRKWLRALRDLAHLDRVAARTNPHGPGSGRNTPKSDGVARVSGC